jgi:hypothetical protein
MIKLLKIVNILIKKLLHIVTFLKTFYYEYHI